jgi:hypothetical protein
MRMALWTLSAVLAAAPLTGAEAQRRMSAEAMAALGDPNQFWNHPDFHGNTPYDGRFTFVRIKYRGFAHFTNEGPGWAHDYPRAESHLMRIMREVSSMRPFVQRGPIIGGNVLSLDDPELFKYPVAYFSEPGGWYPQDAEIYGMRAYLMKGGFIIFDDFQGTNDWLHFVQQMQRVLPKGRIVEIEASHPIFDAFFKIDPNAMSGGQGMPGFGGGQRGRPTYYGIYQDNDPKKRLLTIINYNNDIGDFWQFSDEGFFPVELSNEAYKLGVNYIIYALTH